MPRAAQTLGLQFLAIDPDAGTIELSFETVEDWTNPAGNVLGAFVAAMLYDVVGPALLATPEPTSSSRRSSSACTSCDRGGRGG